MQMTTVSPSKNQFITMLEEFYVPAQYYETAWAMIHNWRSGMVHSHCENDEGKVIQIAWAYNEANNLCVSLKPVIEPDILNTF